MRAIVLLLTMTLTPAPPLAAADPAPTIDWPDFFGRVFVEGVEYSAKLRQLEGRRVRVRGYSISAPRIPGALLLAREPFAASDAEETEIPFDAVAAVWREGIDLPPVPARPTIEGTLRLGNREIGGQIVSITLEDASPVYPGKIPSRVARAKSVPGKSR